MPVFLLLIALLPAAFAAELPAIQSIVNGASFQPGLSSATWVTIRGTALSATTRAWQASDFQGTALPTSLDGVKVLVNGQATNVAYISPTQLNVLTPSDPTTGTVPVQVINTAGTSAAVQVAKTAAAPGIFTFSQQSGRYAIAQNASTFELLAPSTLLGSSLQTRPPKPGEPVALYATGLGAASSVQVSIGGQPAQVAYAGLIGPGLSQINVTVPKLPAGEYPLSLLVNGAQSQTDLYLKVQDVLPGAFCYEFQGLSAFGDPGITTFQMANGVPEPVITQANGITTTTYDLTGFPGHNGSFVFRALSNTAWDLSRIVLTRGPSSSGMTLLLGVTNRQPDVTVTLVGPPALFPSSQLPASIPPLKAYEGTPDSIASMVTVMLQFKLSLPSTPLYIVRDCKL